VQRWRRRTSAFVIGSGGDGELKRKRADESAVVATALQAGGGWGGELSKLRRCATPGWLPGSSAATSTVPTAAASAAVFELPRSAGEWRSEIVKIDSGADREEYCCKWKVRELFRMSTFLHLSSLDTSLSLIV